MAVNYYPKAKIKIDYQDTISGEKFSEEPFYFGHQGWTVYDTVDPSGSSQSTQYVVDSIMEAMDTMSSLTGANITSKHIIYDIADN